MKRRCGVILNNYPVIGGVYSIVNVFLRILEKRYDEIYLICRIRTKNLKVPLNVKTVNISYHPTLAKVFSFNHIVTFFLNLFSGTLFAFLLYIKDVKKYYCHDSITAFYAVFLSKIFKDVEVIIFDHGKIMNISKGSQEYISKNKLNITKKIHFYLMKKILQFNLRGADYVFVGSGEIRNKAIELGCDVKKIVVYNYPVDNVFEDNDVKRSEKNRVHFELDSKIILYVGRLEAIKGLEYLLEAFANIRNEYRSLKIKLFIVGDGTIKGYLKDLAKKLRIYDDVIFYGEVKDKRELKKILSIGDVFVYPSVISGGVSMSILEAAMMKLPVITTTVGPTKEVLKNCIYVEPKNSEQLKEAILKILRDEEYKNSIGKAIHNEVKNRFTAKQFEELLISGGWI